MNLLTVGVGIIQLIIAVIFAVIALYIGFYVFGKVTKEVEEQKELAKGNVAFGIVVAAIFVAIGIVAESGVAGISVGISKAWVLGFTSVDGLIVIVVAINPAGAGRSPCDWCHLPGLKHPRQAPPRKSGSLRSFKKGNVAVALEMAGVIIAVALIIQVRCCRYHSSTGLMRPC